MVSFFAAHPLLLKKLQNWPYAKSLFLEDIQRHLSNNDDESFLNSYFVYGFFILTIVDSSEHKNHH